MQDHKNPHLLSPHIITGVLAGAVVGLFGLATTWTACYKLGASSSTALFSSLGVGVAAAFIGTGVGFFFDHLQDKPEKNTKPDETQHTR